MHYSRIFRFTPSFITGVIGALILLIFLLWLFLPKEEEKRVPPLSEEEKEIQKQLKELDTLRKARDPNNSSPVSQEQQIETQLEELDTLRTNTQEASPPPPLSPQTIQSQIEELSKIRETR